MKYSLHGMVTWHSNVLTDIHIAGLTGYAGVELHTDKLFRFLEYGGSGQELKEKLDKHNVEASAIDIIAEVEATDRMEHIAMFALTNILCDVASVIGSPTIQLNAFSKLSGLPKSDIISLTAKNIREICKIGERSGLRFQYEGAAWTPIHSLQDCLDLVEEVNMPNFGLVIDFWHFWASRGATPEQIAKLDKDIIYGVHCCGGERPGDDEVDAEGNFLWDDEKEYRGYFPGGEDESEDIELLPVKEWADAIIATGYDGWVSGEFLNDGVWEGDNLDSATTMRECLERFLGKQ